MLQRNRAIGVALLLALSAGLSASALADLLPGDRVPASPERSRSVDGRIIALDHYRGDAGTLVIFTGNACAEAIGWSERIVELTHEFRYAGVSAVLVNSNDPAKSPADSFAKMQESATLLGMKIPYVVDETSSVAREFGATRTPEAFLFDGGGRLVYHGAVDDNLERPDLVGQHYLREALEALVSGNEIPLPETEPVGCPILMVD